MSDDDPERSETDQWLDDWDTMGLWEYQLQPLTVGELRAALESFADDLAVRVEHYDGSGHVADLRPMHIDATGSEGRATSVVITVA